MNDLGSVPSESSTTKDKYDLNYMALAKDIGLYPTRRGRSYSPPGNLSADGFLALAISRYYDLNPHLPRPAGRAA